MSSRYDGVFIAASCGIGIVIGSYFTSIIMDHSNNTEITEPTPIQSFDRVSEVGYNSADLGIYEDNETGCQYVVAANRGGMVPRLRANGEIWCGENEGSM